MLLRRETDKLILALANHVGRDTPPIEHAIDPRVAEASVLLDAGRTDDALALLDAIVFEKATLDALELRAKALDIAGLVVDARKAYERFVRAAGEASEPRVRLARSALDRLRGTRR